MRHPLTQDVTGAEAGETPAESRADGHGITRPIVIDRAPRPPGRSVATELELIFPVVNGEDEVPAQLADAASSLLALDVSVGIAVVDGGSSDRTIEAVDEVAAESLVPIRVLGSSTPGWGPGALRGLTTSRARWVGFGQLGAFDRGTVGVLNHAARLLGDGQHIVCAAAEGQRVTVLETPVAKLLFDDGLPDGPGFVPALPDTVRHAGLRMAATSSTGTPR